MAAAPGLLFWLFVLCPTWRVLGQPDPSTGQRFWKHKLCADDECSMLMYRGEALEDFRGPDCRFVNFKKGDPVYVYYKLAEVSPELWARSVGHIFGYFPKDFIKVVREYTKEELQISTDETDFVCFDGGRDDFDNYSVEELLGFLELYDSANEDSEKAIEKVEQFPEVYQDVEPEPKPVVANSEQIESAFSENTMDLEEQFLAQKNHPHADSQTDNAQGEQTSFEPFEEILQDELKVPESENNKTSNSSQVSNEQKTNAYTLLKKEMTLDLKTKFGYTADALVSDYETTRLVTSLDEDFDDEELDADYYAFDKEEEENEESFGELPLLTSISEEGMKFPVEFGVEKYSIGEEQNSNEEDKVEVTLPPGIKDDDKNILTTLEDTLFIGTGGDEKTDMMDLGNSYSEEEKEDEEATDNDEEPKVDIELHIKGKETDVQEPKKHLMQDVSELEDEKIEGMIAYTSPQSNKLSSLPAVEKGKDTLKSAFENKENDLKEAVIHISKDSKEVNEELSSPGEKILEDSSENKSLHKAVGSLMTQEQSKPPESLGIATFLGDNQNDTSKDGMEEPGSVNTPTLHIDSVEHQPQEIKEGLVLKTENQSGFSSPDGIGLLREPEEEVHSPRKNFSWQQERDVIVTVSHVNEKIGLSKVKGKEQSLAEELIQHKATQGTQEIKKTEQTDEVEVPGLHTERPASVEEDYYPPEELLEDENAVSAKQSKEKHSGIQNVNQHVLEKAILETINPDLETKENKQEMSIIWEIFKKSETTAKRVDMMDKERGDMEMGKEESPLVDEEAQGLFDGSDEENTQTSGISEVFQDKNSDDLEKDNPKEHLNTSGSTEKATGKEISKEDLEDIGHITDAESQGPAYADLEDDILPQSPHIALKPELSDQEEDLPIIRSFFTEQKSLQRFLKYFDVQELEAMLQEMSLKLKSAQQESLPYNVEKVLDKVFHVSESHILSVAEQMLDNCVNDIRDIGIKEKLLITEGTPVDDADTEKQLKDIKLEEPADATLLDNVLSLLYSYLLYFTKMKLLENIEEVDFSRGVTEQQIAQKIINFMKEDEELIQKFSKYEEKIKESEKQIQETMKQNMILSDEATKYKDKIKLLEKAKEFLDERAKSLHVMLESEREQNAKNHDLIIENKKSIEKLEDVISVNTSEFSELQIVFNEAKLREEKVKLECCQLQKENTILKTTKEQLQQEVKDWCTSHAELSEHIKSFEKSQKDLLVFLNHKDDTINALTNYITQLNRLQCESESEDQNREDESDELTNGEVAGDRNEKIKDQIKQMMDVSRTQTTISVVEEDLKLLQLMLRASMPTKCNLKDQIKKLEGDCNSLQSSKVGLEEECKTLRQKVEILNELYQKNEMALQKKQSQEECERLEKEQQLSAADEKVFSAVQEVKNYKRRIEEMEEELQKTERSFKNQIAMHVKKAHDNWLKARSAERAIAEEKREAANLRQKLLEMTQKMAMWQDEPVIVKPMPGRPNLQNPPRRGPLSHNGSFGPSPVSGGDCSPSLTAEPAGRPPSATLNQRDMPRNGFGSMDGPLPRTQWSSEASGKPVASDPGYGPAHMNSSSKSSSPAKVTDEGNVNMAMKGPPPFSGVPFMGPPMEPPMRRPPPPPFWYGPPFQLGGPFGPRPIPPPFGPSIRPPIDFREYAPGVPPGQWDLPFDPRDFFPGPAPFRPLGSFGPREYFIPGAPLPPPTHGPQDYGPPPAAKDLMSSGFKDEPPPTPDSQSSEGCSQALKQGP
ncbi:transport and Golgi organization protein 1 homolog [Callospermophilus lateralis]